MLNTPMEYGVYSAIWYATHGGALLCINNINLVTIEWAVLLRTPCDWLYNKHMFHVGIRVQCSHTLHMHISFELMFDIIWRCDAKQQIQSGKILKHNYPGESDPKWTNVIIES